MDGVPLAVAFRAFRIANGPAQDRFHEGVALDDASTWRFGNKDSNGHGVEQRAQLQIGAGSADDRRGFHQQVVQLGQSFAFRSQTLVDVLKAVSDGVDLGDASVAPMRVAAHFHREESVRRVHVAPFALRGAASRAGRSLQGRRPARCLEPRRRRARPQPIVAASSAANAPDVRNSVSRAVAMARPAAAWPAACLAAVRRGREH